MTKELAYPTRIKKDSFFLSEWNPACNADQRDMEELGVKLMQSPIVAAGMRNARSRWLTVFGKDATDEITRRLDDFIQQYTFNYVMKAVNSDANYPKVLGFVYSCERESFGRKLPGTRAGGGDGPDQHYSVIPIDYGGKFRIDCQRLGPACPNTPYTLTGSIGMTMTLASLEDPDIVIGADGKFSITLDPEPANGRINHIQTQPNAKYLFIRDCRADWRQLPCARRVERLTPPTMPPLSEEMIAKRAVQFMAEDVSAMYWFIRVFDALEHNVVTKPFATGAIGGLVSQQISFLRAKLREDEALVITTNASNATFRDIVLHDRFFASLDYGQHLTSLNNSQGRDNGDGTITYVISMQDPAVYNWLDPMGLHELLIVHRWQGLTQSQNPIDSPAATSKLVKLADLGQHLPAKMARVTAEQRKGQLAERYAQFKTRFRDM